MTDDDLKNLFAGLRQELGAMSGEIGTIRGEIGAIREETASLRQEIATIREENVSMHAETRRWFEATLTENIGAVRQENVAMHTETRRHFDVVAEDLRHSVVLVTEVLTGTREQLVREAADIRDEMRSTAADTQALVKFSYTDLDRRVRVLEEK